MGNYLGIPESLGGSKTQIFIFLNYMIIIRSIAGRLDSLLKGGKEVIINSVTSAMPNHVMSCFKLPETITKKITGAISHFWWGSNRNKKDIHWHFWDIVCKHKAEGGLSFKDLQDFNTALLAKQLWRLIEKPDCLFSRVFKGRYFRKLIPRDSYISYSPSYGWRSICQLDLCLKKG